MDGAVLTDRDYPIGAVLTRVRFLPRSGLLGALPVESLVVFDEHTFELFGAGLAAASRPPVVLRAGEAHKSWPSVERILEAALEARLGREATLVACGGGVVCDTAAFAASIYLRGVRAILVPTTLLSMIDASLGGKTGIDFGGYKNMVGTFHPASEVRIATELLATLPERELVSGLAEAIKHALLSRGDLLSLLRERRADLLRRDAGLLAGVVARSLDVKGGYVAADFRESGIRSHLNFGHTFAHALESVSGFADWTHGEAVAWGIDKALRTGRLLGLTDPGYEEEVRELLLAYGYRLGLEERLVEPLLRAMKADKKRRGGSVRFVLQRRWGETLLSEADDDVVRRALGECAEAGGPSRP